MFGYDWIEIMFGTLIAVLVCVILYLFFIFVDTVAQPEYNANGVILSKEFIPAHTTYHSVATANGGSMLMPTHVADSWNVEVLFMGVNGSCAITEHLYNTLDIDDLVGIQYVEGRITGDKYLQSVLKKLDR